MHPMHTMTYFLIGASLLLALDCMTRGNSFEFTDATYYLFYCLAYAFLPAAVGFGVAIINRLVKGSRTPEEFASDRNWGWVIFLGILAIGQLFPARPH